MRRSDRFVHFDPRRAQDALCSGLPLPRVRLTSLQRQAIGARFFYGAPIFVDLVGRACADHPDLFPDQSGEALLTLQARADAWRALCAQLEMLLQRARDHYLIDQADAIDQAQTTIVQLRAQAAAPRSPEERRLLQLRYQVLLPAMIEWQHERDRQEARRRKARGLPPPRRRPPSPRQARLARQSLRLLIDMELRRRAENPSRSGLADPSPTTAASAAAPAAAAPHHKAAAILRLLDALGVDPADPFRAQVTACSDPATLDRWLTRALAAADPAQAAARDPR